MANEFNIKNGFISNSDSKVIGGFTATTISAGTITTPLISATTISATTISATTISATTISATTISGGTYYGNGTNLTGVVKGSGTTNYLPKWTGTTGLGNSIIQDNGSTIGIGNTPNSAYKFYVYGVTITGVYGETQGGTNKYGVIGANIGDETGTYVGIYGFGSAADTPYVDSIYVGGKFLADGSQNNLNYAGWFVDGTEGLNKVLISATADGKTNWSSDLTGLTSVSATTISGGTIVITSTPTNNNSNTEILSRNSTTGNVEYIDSSTIGGGSFNYGLANAIMTGTFLT